MVGSAIGAASSAGDSGVNTEAGTSIEDIGVYPNEVLPLTMPELAEKQPSKGHKQGEALAKGDDLIKSSDSIIGSLTVDVTHVKVEKDVEPDQTEKDVRHIQGKLSEQGCRAT